jgi:hypothetical protein
VRPAHKTCLFRNSASTPALRLTLPITVAVAGLLVVLVVSCCPVIAVHPDGGGSSPRLS